MSEATCIEAQRRHTSVAGGEPQKGHKPLKIKDFFETPRVIEKQGAPGRIGPGTSCFSKTFFLSGIFSFMKAPHFCVLTPGDRGPASQDDAAAAPSLINGTALRS